MSATNTERSKIGHLIWVLAVPIVIGWFAVNVATNTLVPPLEKVGEAHTVGLSAKDGPAMVSMKQIGANFQEFDSDSNAMIVLESDQPLGAEAHHYYDGLVAKLTANTAHVEHVADFWSDPLTAVGSQSADGKAAYVQVYLRGNQGETKANDSVASVRQIVADSKPPAGLHVYVTGGAPLVSDQHHAGDKSVARPVPRLEVEITTLVHLHSSLLVAYLSFVIGLGFALLAVRAPKPVLLRLAVLAGLVLAQGAVGAVQFYTGVPAVLVAIHVAGAGACTAATAALWASMRSRCAPSSANQ